MIIKVDHETEYQYNSPVFLEPQYLHFHPQNREYIRLNSFDIKINPIPTSTSHRLDAENNTMIQCLFSDPTERFKISAHLEIEMHAFNPFNFFIEDSVTKKAEDQMVLEAYLKPLEEVTQRMVKWLNYKIKDVEENPVDLLSHLIGEIHNGWDHSPRYKKNLLKPDTCFNQNSGSCRDLSWMLIHFLRHLKIPARFVSGYAFNDQLGEGHELHAWVEAWLPGAGWIGIDPSSGLWTTQEYIPIATSYEPQRTMPVTGSYRGEAKSTLTTKVHIGKI